MNISKVAFFVVLSVFVSRADAMGVSYYQSLKEKDREALEFYMEGVSQGLLWSQALSSIRHEVKVYCQPEGLSLNVENYIDVVDKTIEFYSEEGKPVESDTPIEMLLMFGLERTFPCE